MMKFRFNKKKAFGLLEVLIAIAISAMVMVGAIAVSSKGIRTVKKNELEDLSNGILLQSLEIARSPVNFNLDSLVSGSNTTYFVLVKTAEGEVALQKKETGAGEISTCDQGSQYKVDIIDIGEDLEYVDSDFAEAYTICNQIIVDEVSNDGIRRKFQINSVVVYKLYDQDIKLNLISERTEIVNNS